MRSSKFVFGASLKAGGLCLLLGTAPGFAGGPPNVVVSDSLGNTAGGSGALFNTNENPLLGFGGNTAFGQQALQSNTTGPDNAAFGNGALLNNTVGGANTAVGEVAAARNTTGFDNTAVGAGALFANTTGQENTAVGTGALNISTGAGNTAVGRVALGSNNIGSNNIALGNNAGGNLRSGSNDIYLGNAGTATESNTMRLGGNQTSTFIAGITGTPVTGSQVVVNSSGQLGILASSARYKAGIRDMGDRSRRLSDLRPVTFHYKQDPQKTQQFGLIAEEVAKVYPELVTHNSDGKIESVQYHELIAMLLNELQRQQRELGALKAQNARFQGALAEQTAALKTRLVRLEETAHSPAFASR